MFKIKYRYIFIFLLSLYSYVNILFTEGHKLFGFELNPFLFFSVLLIIVFLVWEVNRMLYALAFQIPLKKIHPLIILFLLSVGNVFLISALTTLAFNFYSSNYFNPIISFKLCLGFSFRVNLFLHCINAIYFFISQYKTAQLEAERLKKQNIEARFQTLRNQINPHFLFNSFNVLSTLVYKDADVSAKFIEQLSNVYRYILYNQDNKIVTIQDELAFIESYIYLLKIRFKDNIIIKKSIGAQVRDKYIAPAALQLLIENAIKHNVVSRAEPLNIRIYNSENHLVVENNIQLKEVKEESTGIGLRNIQERYDYLSADNPMVIEQTDIFKVKIPIIEVS
ncbi:sensor histidine kinase [Fulvivirga sediminis]|uniref:Histidine kinase n=1 Tax=Fulvivirga sediminis TaxID=2803949 RepID=A0A937F5K8_9BACT|nr:histidine kinase [Fulvivirga sediminis]MBL3654523.1 histidine kinase [Fulvivirga sediminis]